MKIKLTIKAGFRALLTLTTGFKVHVQITRTHKLGEDKELYCKILSGMPDTIKVVGFNTNPKEGELGIIAFEQDENYKG